MKGGFSTFFNNDLGKIRQLGEKPGDAVKQAQPVHSQRVVVNHDHDFVEELIHRAFYFHDFSQSLGIFFLGDKPFYGRLRKNEPPAWVLPAISFQQEIGAPVCLPG